MDPLDQSDELIRRCGELRAQSVQACATADKTMEKSRQLLVAASKARKAVRHARGLESIGPGGKATADDLPAGQ
jgi:hypothetical protein